MQKEALPWDSDITSSTDAVLHVIIYRLTSNLTENKDFSK